MCDLTGVNALILLSCGSFGMAIYIWVSSPAMWARRIYRGRSG